MNAKYIRTSNDEFYLFPTGIKHSDFAKKVGIEKPKSAGTIVAIGGDAVLTGGSDTLGLLSLDGDEQAFWDSGVF